MAAAPSEHTEHSYIVVREAIAACRVPVMSGPIESSDDSDELEGVSRRVAQAACDSDTSGSDHAVDDGDDSDSEMSMRCEFVDSMAAKSRSVHSDGGATSADSDPSETD